MVARHAGASVAQAPRQCQLTCPLPREIRGSAVFFLPELALNTAHLLQESLPCLGALRTTQHCHGTSQLAEVEEKIEQLHQEQANNDFFLLAELLSDYICLLAIVRVSTCPSPLFPPLDLLCLSFALLLPKMVSSIIA